MGGASNKPGKVTSASVTISAGTSMSIGIELQNAVVKRSDGAPAVDFASKGIGAGAIVKNVMYKMLVKMETALDSIEMKFL